VYPSQLAIDAKAPVPPANLQRTKTSYLTWVSALLLLMTAVRADESTQVRAAVQGLYASLAAGDTAALSHYLPAAGFTEFNTDGTEVKTLDQAYFARALGNGVRVDFHVEQPRVVILGRTAMVTGYRVGSLWLPGGQRITSRNCLSMWWSHEPSGWLLRHVHLSDCPLTTDVRHEP
jgi:ketosteroid isomerase-like protein